MEPRISMARERQERKNAVLNEKLFGTPDQPPSFVFEQPLSQTVRELASATATDVMAQILRERKAASQAGHKHTPVAVDARALQRILVQIGDEAVQYVRSEMHGAHYCEPSGNDRVIAWRQHLSYVATLIMAEDPTMPFHTALGLARRIFIDRLPAGFVFPLREDCTFSRFQLVQAQEAVARNNWVLNFSPQNQEKDVAMNVPSQRAYHTLYAHLTYRGVDWFNSFWRFGNMPSESLQHIYSTPNHHLHEHLVLVVAVQRYAWMVTKYLEAKVNQSNAKLQRSKMVMPWSEFQVAPWSEVLKDVGQFAAGLYWHNDELR